MTETDATTNNAMRLVWLDIETTGLNPERDVILEIAAVVTDRNLDEFAHMELLVVHDTMPECDAFVRDMHTKNGLFAELAEAAARCPQAYCQSTVEDLIFRLIVEFCPNKSRTYLAGRSIHFDRGFLEIHMPRLLTVVSHRMLDTRSLHIAREIADATPQPGSDAAAHRAMPDVRMAISDCDLFAGMFRAGVQVPP